jgi:maltose alpha-D-glucosyltransferase/alpha-amylase
MLNPRAATSDATFPINVPFKKTKLLAGDKFKMEHSKKAGTLTIHMPPTSYAIVKLQ